MSPRARPTKKTSSTARSRSSGASQPTPKGPLKKAPTKRPPATRKDLPTFEDAIARSGPSAQSLARALRALIAAVHPTLVEVPWPNQQITGIGVGPKKQSEHYCYIGAFADYVNLGFNYGADLPDPQGLLEGTGKKFRHVKIRHQRELERPALRKLIQAAVKERGQALGR